MTKLEKLCHPMIRTLCEYWCFSRAGGGGDAETLQRTIKGALVAIQDECENDPNLKRDFKRIERPLIFFVDYTIKEGHFPFSRDWRELAREYNELSGDEKFFDLLTETLDDPDASERLMIFYLFMGLGFDGCHRGDPDFVERRMKLCATRFQPGFNLLREPLSENVTPQMPDVAKRRQTLAIPVILAFTVLFALAALIYNCYIFNLDTRDYRNALEDAMSKLRPAYVKSNLTPETASNGVKHE